MKRFLKLLLACMLILLIIPTDASAAASGTIDEHISWTLSDDGTLLVYGSGEIPDYDTYDSPWYDNDSITSVIMESGITRIGRNSFRSCSNLSDVTLPSNLKEIGSFAFINSGLTEITFPEGLQTIENNAFTSLPIARMELPDSITAVDSTNFTNHLTYLKWTAGIPVVPAEVFDGRTLLETVVIPEGVTEIADGPNNYSGAFTGCTALKSVTLPSTLVKIGDYAFRNCTALEEIYVEAETIGYDSFNYCPGLNSVTLSERIREIGSYAFGQCGVIEELKFQGDAPTIEEYAFNYATVTAYYPAGNVTWTKDFMEAFYGGTITWVPYGSTEGDDEKDPESSTPDLDWFFAMADHIDENYLWATSFYIRLMEQIS